MASLLFPLQFERQYSGPLDQDQVFTNTSDRLTYLTNPLRYAGQIVTDLETNKAYQLNSSKDTWIELGDSSTFIQTNSANWHSTYTTVQSKSANWDSAYSSAGADLLVRSLTGYWDSTHTTTQTNSGNWSSVYSSVNPISANWNSVYSSVASTSANWDSAYSYVAANSVNLTATNIFVTNDLTVTDTVSAKYYQGTLIDWMTLVRGTKTTPTLLATIGTGDVYTYVYSTATTDKTYYRYIATDGSEDSFYGNFTNPTLSNLIATKKIIL